MRCLVSKRAIAYRVNVLQPSWPLTNKTVQPKITKRQAVVNVTETLAFNCDVQASTIKAYTKTLALIQILKLIQTLKTSSISN